MKVIIAIDSFKGCLTSKEANEAAAEGIRSACPDAELYGKARSTINEHILNAYKEKEIEEAKTMRKIGNSDFSTKPTNYYNLDVIISVGYRVKSIVGTRFRQWATEFQ